MNFYYIIMYLKFVFLSCLEIELQKPLLQYHGNLKQSIKKDYYDYIKATINHQPEEKENALQNLFSHLESEYYEEINKVIENCNIIIPRERQYKALQLINDLILSEINDMLRNINNKAWVLYPFRRNRPHFIKSWLSYIKDDTIKELISVNYTESDASKNMQKFLICLFKGKIDLLRHNPLEIFDSNAFMPDPSENNPTNLFHEWYDSNMHKVYNQLLQDVLKFLSNADVNLLLNTCYFSYNKFYILKPEIVVDIFKTFEEYWKCNLTRFYEVFKQYLNENNLE